ncbi:6-bladed beta-propeller [Phocaeicola sp.]
MYKTVCIALLMVCLMGCHSTKEKSEYPILAVDLNSAPAQMSDLFSKIEVIPLETSDSSLLTHPGKILDYKNLYFIFDLGTRKVSVYNYSGIYLYNIGSIGNGPGEYTYISDISINEEEGIIHLLAPFGYYLDYSTEGIFIEKKVLPSENSNYQFLCDFNGSLLTWTSPSDNKSNCISVIHPQSMEIENTFGKGACILKKFSNNLYSYGNSIYHAQTLESNNVYEVSKDSLKLAYRWDFGKDNIDMYNLGLTFEDDENIQVEEAKRLRKYIEDGTIPYWIPRQFQNDKYYFANLRFAPWTNKNIFYRKSDHKYFILGKDKDDIQLFPVAFTNKYMMCVELYHEEYEKYKSVLSEEEYRKLEALNEDDNPCLIKFYFK